MIQHVEQWSKLITAIAGLFGAGAWPLAAVFMVWWISRKHRDVFERAIDRIKSLTLPGGTQFDLEVAAMRRCSRPGG
jgi:hypothetical protein